MPIIILKDIDMKIITSKERLSGKKHLISGNADEILIEKQLSKSDDDLNSRIEARRAERAKRVQDLLKSTTKEKY